MLAVNWVVWMLSVLGGSLGWWKNNMGVRNGYKLSVSEANIMDMFSWPFTYIIEWAFGSSPTPRGEWKHVGPLSG